MEYDVEQLENLGGTFVRIANRKAVWEFETLADANKAIKKFGKTAYPYNWDPQQQDGPETAKPTVSFIL